MSLNRGQQIFLSHDVQQVVNRMRRSAVCRGTFIDRSGRLEVPDIFEPGRSHSPTATINISDTIDRCVDVLPWTGIPLKEASALHPMRN